jgi:hypothetical protein
MNDENEPNPAEFDQTLDQIDQKQAAGSDEQAATVSKRAGRFAEYTAPAMLAVLASSGRAMAQITS